MLLVELESPSAFSWKEHEDWFPMSVIGWGQECDSTPFLSGQQHKVILAFKLLCLVPRHHLPAPPIQKGQPSLTDRPVLLPQPCTRAAASGA